MPDDVDRPPGLGTRVGRRVLAAYGDHLGAPGQRGQPLGAGSRADERRQPVAMDAGLLEPLLLGEGRHLLVDELDHVVRMKQQRIAELAHDRGVGARVDAAVARRQAPAELGEDACRARRMAAEPVGALADRERLVQGRQAALGGRPGRERPEVVGVVVEDPLDQRQARPRLPGELDERDLLREPRSPVVARLVLRDQPQLPDLGLERGRALDAGDRRREPHHLTDPGPGLGGREVGADPLAQVLGGAHVEHPGLVVAEQVDAGGVGEPVGEVAFAALRGRHLRGVGLQLLKRVDAQAAEALHEPVQHVDRRARVGERTVVGGGAGTEHPRQRRQLVVGRLVTGHHPAGDLDGVDDLEVGPREVLLARRSGGGTRRRSRRCGRPAPSRARTPGRPAARTSIGGASATMPLVMPVSTAMNAGIEVCGLTRVWNSPRTSPPRTFTAPISVILSPSPTDPPVVSRSTTQNVTSRNGRPSSSKERCSSQRLRTGAVVMSSTVGGTSDTTR